MANILTSALSSSANSNYFDSKRQQRQADLFFVIRQNDENSVKKMADLIYLGASDSEAFNNETPLSVAMNSGNFGAFHYLINNLKADIEYKFPYINGKEYPLIWFALWENKLPYFKMLLAESKQRDIRNPENNGTLLIEATKMVNPAAVEICLNSNKINVNAVDRYKKTALHHALTYKPSEFTKEHGEIINLLIDHNANPELIDLDGNRPSEIHEKLKIREELEIKAELEAQQAPKQKRGKKNVYTKGMNKTRRTQSLF